MTIPKKKPGNQPGSVRVDPNKKKERFSSRLPADILSYLRGHEEKLAVYILKAIEERKARLGE